MSSMKVSGLSSHKLLFVQDVHPQRIWEEDPSEGAGTIYVAVDLAGAGDDEIVLVATGSAARIDTGASVAPTDAAVVGIVDALQFDKATTYFKQ